MKIPPTLYRLYPPTSQLATTRSGIGTSFYYCWKSHNKLTGLSQTPGKGSWNASECSPPWPRSAGPRRSELISVAKSTCSDWISSHKISNRPDLLEQALIEAGIIGEGDGQDEADNDLLLDLPLSDLDWEDEYEAIDIDDILDPRTPPPPFRPPPSPDDTENEDSEQSDQNNDGDDDRKSQHTQSSAAEDSDADSQSDASDSAKDEQDQYSDFDEMEDDNRSQHSEDETSVPNIGLGQEYQWDFKPEYVRPDINIDKFITFCDVPDRFCQWMRQGAPLYVNWPFSKARPKNLTDTEQQQAQRHIDELIKQEIIETTGKSPFVSYPKIVPKPGGRSRLVIDYSHITEHMNKMPFLLPSVYQVVQDKVQHLQKGLFAIKVDLTNAFYHVKVKEEAKHVTVFKWKGRYYRFNRLPMGMRASPFYMQMFLNQIVKVLRPLAEFVWGHMDDVLIIGDLVQLREVKTVLCKLEQLGIEISSRKSSLAPRKTVVYCGAKWDLNKRVITITKSKRDKLKLAWEAWPTATDKQKRALRGFIAYLWPLLDNSWISMRPLYRQRQTSRELSDIQTIMSTAPGTMSLTKSRVQVKHVSYADATPSQIGWFTPQGPRHERIPTTNILTAEAIALLMAMEQADPDTLVYTDNQPLFFMLKNRKTHKRDTEWIIMRLLDLMDAKNLWVAW